MARAFERDEIGVVLERLATDRWRGGRVLVHDDGAQHEAVDGESVDLERSDAASLIEAFHKPPLDPQ